MFLLFSSKPKGPGEEGARRNHSNFLFLRKWPISSADFPMTPMEAGGPFFSWPLCLTADLSTLLRLGFGHSLAFWSVSTKPLFLLGFGVVTAS